MRDTILGILFLAFIAGAYAYLPKNEVGPPSVSARLAHKPIAKGRPNGERPDHIQSEGTQANRKGKGDPVAASEVEGLPSLYEDEGYDGPAVRSAVA